MPEAAAPPHAGKTIVVTGASDGIGRAAARQFVLGGAACVVMVGRNPAKTEAAARAIVNDTGRPVVGCETADLSRRDEVAALGHRLRTRHPVIDVLANNAGALFLERGVTADGVERTLALNHLAYLQLSLALLEPLAAAARPGAPARILCVSSRAHRNARLSLDDLELTRGYGGWRAYANSKLCNIWCAQALARRLDPARIVVHSLHPGVVRTRFAENNGPLGQVLRRLMDLVSITPEAGADTLTWLASAPDALAHSGGYWVRRTRTAPSADGRDADKAEQCWAASLALLGLGAGDPVPPALARVGHG